MKTTKTIFGMLVMSAMAVVFAVAPTQAQVVNVDKGASPKHRPSILFCSPSPPGSGFVDLNYLKQLYAAGYNVDYTNSLDDLAVIAPAIQPKIDIKNYNVLVIYTGPCVSFPTTYLTESQFDAMIKAYVNNGGGLLLMIPQQNMNSTAPIIDQATTEYWGLDIAAEQMIESNPANIISAPRLGASTAYTSNINASSPVTAGVSGIWYPYFQHYFAQATGPLILTNSNPSNTTWTVAVSATTTTRTLQEGSAWFTGDSWSPANPKYYPREYPLNPPTSQPPIFATGTVTLGGQGGRIAAMVTKPQYSVGSGTTWFYNNNVLVNGFNGKPSDFGRLLENTLTWLGEPSMANPTWVINKWGAFVTNPTKFVPVNYQSGPFAGQSGFGEKTWTQAEIQAYGTPPTGVTMAKGLIGAKTSYSNSCYSTVAQYAAEARNLGLSFVVFADDYTALTPETLASLTADCIANSSETLQLYPGYNIQTNVGNHVLFFGPTNKAPALPTPNCLTGTGRDTRLLYPSNPDTWNWMYNGFNGGVIPSLGNICFYDFSAAEAAAGLRMPDLHDYAMAAAKYYRGGRLVEDKTISEYLPTVGSCSAPTVVAFNEVTTATGGPGSMQNEVTSNHALTYAQIPTGTHPLDKLWSNGLTWIFQGLIYDVFVSNGPLVQAWPGVAGSFTWAGEEYVCGRFFMPTLISVTAPSGAVLTDVSIYNGSTLYRDFKPETASYTNLLYLDSIVQKNLVLIATDSKGGQAVTNYHSNYAVTGMAVIFCSDHLNDCKSPSDGNVLLDHEPRYNFPVTAMPNLSNPGATWDGGPATASPLGFWTPYGTQSSPALTSNLGKEDGGPFYQTPTLEFTDEGAAAVDSTGVVPASQSPLMTYVEQYREWNQPTIGPVIEGWPANGIRIGVKPTLYRDLITFQKAQTITNLELLTCFGKPWPHQQVYLVLSQGKTVQRVELDTLAAQTDYHLAAGDWFGVYSAANNIQLFVNRGAPVILTVGNSSVKNSTWKTCTNGMTTWMSLWADVTGQQVAANQTNTYELATFSYALDSTAVGSQAELINMMAYLNRPTGLTLYGSTVHASSPGLLDLSNPSGAVEFSVTAPPGRPTMTLPARVTGLNPNWSAGMWLESGYQKGDYSPLTPYAPLGIDIYGNAYIPVELNIPNTTVPITRIMAGHPVVADSAGTKLIIQVTKINDNPALWHVSVNNPTSRAIRSTITRKMAIPGLTFTRQAINIPSGGYRVLE